MSKGQDLVLWIYKRAMAVQNGEITATELAEDLALHVQGQEFYFPRARGLERELREIPQYKRDVSHR